MPIRILEVRKPRHHSCAAEVKLELALDGHSITLDDVRVLPGRRGDYWVALPAYSVSNGSRDYRYYPSVTLSGGLMGETEEAVLTAFEDWKKTQA